MLGMKQKAGCGCAKMIRQMNAWGIEGCRAHRPEIVEHLQKAYHELTRAEVAKAAGNAVLSGLFLRLSWGDVCGSLVDLAIERAEATMPR